MRPKEGRHNAQWPPSGERRQDLQGLRFGRKIEPVPGLRFDRGRPVGEKTVGALDSELNQTLPVGGARRTNGCHDAMFP